MSFRTASERLKQAIKTRHRMASEATIPAPQGASAGVLPDAGIDGSYLRSNGTLWERVFGVRTSDVLPGTFSGDSSSEYIFPGQVKAPTIFITGNATPLLLFFPTSGATVIGQFQQIGNVWSVAQFGGAAHFSLNIATGAATLAGVVSFSSTINVNNAINVSTTILPSAHLNPSYTSLLVTNARGLGSQPVGLLDAQEATDPEPLTLTYTTVDGFEWLSIAGSHTHNINSLSGMPLTLANGGTGRTTLASGSLLYGPASGTAMDALAIGASGELLMVSAGAVPDWVTSLTGAYTFTNTITFNNPVFFVSNAQIGTGVLFRFGGSTTSFPALRNNLAVLEARLGDNSAYANFRAADLTVSGITATTSSVSLGVTTNLNAAINVSTTVLAQATTANTSILVTGTRGLGSQAVRLLDAQDATDPEPLLLTYDTTNGFRFLDASGGHSHNINSLTGTPLWLTKGGTGIAALASGSMLYGPASGTAMDTLPIGAAGELLMSTGAVPDWVTTLTGTYTFSANVTFSNPVFFNSNWQINTGTLARFGGSTTSFPALRNNGAALEVRLADNSAYGNLNINQLNNTGTLATFGDAAGASQQINIRAAAGSQRNIVWQSGTTNRWLIRANSTAESGSDAGTDLEIYGYSDAGSALERALFIARTATGYMMLGRDLFYMGRPTAGAQAYLIFRAPAGTTRGFQAQSNTSPRWIWGVNSTAETGSNAGSNFFWNRYSDTGVFIDAVLSFNRASGLATFSQGVTVGGALTASSTTTLAGAINVSTTVLPAATASHTSILVTGSSGLGSQGVAILDAAASTDPEPVTLTWTTAGGYAWLDLSGGHTHNINSLSGTPLWLTKGGTGVSSVASGTLLYGPASGTAMSALAIGAAGEILVSDGSVPDWATTLSGGYTFSGTNVTFSNVVFFTSGAQITSGALVRFGGTTTSFPALRNNLAVLEVRLADNSALGNLTAATITGNSFVGPLTGNASTATTLQTTRTIWGQNFNGSANVTGALTGVTTISMSGDLTLTGATSDVIVAATAKYRLDGSAAGDTYIYEATADRIDLVAGGTARLLIGTTFVEVGSAADLRLATTKRLYLDGGSDTYISEVSANIMEFRAGGTQAVLLSATSLNPRFDLALESLKKLYFDGGGDTYLYEQSANNMRLVVGGSERLDVTATSAAFYNRIDLSGSPTSGGSRQLLIGTTSVFGSLGSAHSAGSMVWASNAWQNNPGFDSWNKSLTGFFSTLLELNYNSGLIFYSRESTGAATDTFSNFWGAAKFSVDTGGDVLAAGTMQADDYLFN